jgi:hypothetical protein
MLIFGFGLFFLTYTLLALGFIVSNFNIQFLLIIFGFSLISLSKTF